MLSVNSVNSGISFSSVGNNNSEFKTFLDEVKLTDNVDTFEPTENKKSNKKKAIIAGSILASVLTGAILFRKKIAKLFGAGAKKVKTDFGQLLEQELKQIKGYIFEKSEKVGNTVSETIENVFGKNSGIKPHTYNLSEEYPLLHIYRDSGGYKDGFVSLDGVLAKKAEEGAKLPHFVTAAMSQIPTEQVLGNSTIKIFSGVVENDPRKIVRLSIAEPGSNRHTRILLSVLSPNDQFTPVQKDILKLAENLDNVDIPLIDKMTKFYNANNPDGSLILDKVGKYENLDYNLILSAIQSMANKA